MGGEWLRRRMEALCQRLPWLSRAGELVFLAFALVYVATFLILQLGGIDNPHVIEWDARVGTLPAYRFHGTGLFPNDLLVDRALSQCPPLWRLIFWIGTWVADANLLTKILPFVLFAAMLWQGFAFGRKRGGPVLGALICVLLVHCNFIWNRTLGTTARSFGFALVVAFLRYAADGAERRALATLVLQAASYPSVFLCCAPAYALTLWPPRPSPRLYRFAFAVGLGGLLVFFFALKTDPRIGHMITWNELLGLRQKTSGALFPLENATVSIETALKIALYSDNHGAGPLLRGWSLRYGGALVWTLVAALAALAGRRIAEVPRIFWAMLISSSAVFALAYLVPYRLYFPNRYLQFTWPAIFLMLVPLIAALALERSSRHGILCAAWLLVGVEFLFYGDGLQPRMNMRDFGAGDTPVVQFIGGLPKDVLVAGHPETCSQVQTWAHRSVLFSAISNISHFYPHALELDRRADAYYHAYYARDFESVRRFRDTWHVDYLIVDPRDFGSDALARSQWTEPWSGMAFWLVKSGPVAGLVMGHPPAASIVYRDATAWLVDLRRL